jgi:UDPglucose--hexose-1-phosphate uridylyltransferase
MSSELRLDPMTRNWVVLAPSRSTRPHDGDVGCPLCPGAESQTPPEVLRVPEGDGPWRLRVVPNRYPLLDRDGDRPPVEIGFTAQPAAGWHEVVVESPDHGWDVPAGPDEQVLAVLRAYRSRTCALAGAGAAHVAVFRNHGEGSGTSLTHPHSQIVAMRVVPELVRRRARVAAEHFALHGRCLLADVVEQELRDGSRIVVDNGEFTAFAPFAGGSPYETWIVPHAPGAHFATASDGQLEALAVVLRDVLSRLAALEDPAYNLLVDSTVPAEAPAPHLRWHLRIVPRLSTPAGFELATGISVNDHPPEQAAARLRETRHAVAGIDHVQLSAAESRRWRGFRPRRRTTFGSARSRRASPV